MIITTEKDVCRSVGVPTGPVKHLKTVFWVISCHCSLKEGFVHYIAGLRSHKHGGKKIWII